MATLGNKQKLAVVTREAQEEHPRNGQSRNTSVPTINEEYITQVFEEIEGRVTKKLSQEYSRTESRILGALSKLDEFLLNEHIRTHSGTVPETFRNTNVDNQGTNEDDSPSDPHPEAGIFRGQTAQNLGLKDCRDTIQERTFTSYCRSDYFLQTLFITNFWELNLQKIFSPKWRHCYIANHNTCEKNNEYSLQLTFYPEDISTD